MKLVFLDIDGVLNFRCTSVLHTPCLNEIQRIARETGAKFVLSSSWKEVLLSESASEFDKRILHTLMHDSGLDFLGVTPMDPEDLDRRALEIQEWLRSFDGIVDAFVILDDLDYDFDELFPGCFVKTAGYFGAGLTKEHADNAIRILNRV